ncbi:hypothetical protein SNE32_17795, partial [Lysobacter sp. D1-1-M9]|uniref:hypothetical protein n=1 Tax=Novilysobacter longmucuonensis TaxID=3098603 RepID=UPI002FC669E1
VTLDGQIHKPCDLVPGESLHSFLARSVPDFEGQQWEVTIGGVVVPVEHWLRVRPKHGQLIEVRGAVNKQALYIVAMVALAYFTMGIGTAVAGTTAGAAMFGVGTMAATIANAAIFMAGSMLINKAM